MFKTTPAAGTKPPSAGWQAGSDNPITTRLKKHILTCQEGISEQHPMFSFSKAHWSFQKHTTFWIRWVNLPGIQLQDEPLVKIHRIILLHIDIFHSLNGYPNSQMLKMAKGFKLPNWCSSSDTQTSVKDLLWHGNGSSKSSSPIYRAFQAFSPM